MERKISFVDKDGIRFNVDIELNEGRFSMSGDSGGSCGQLQDSIKPTKTQEPLLELWHKYHLNDMNAGTEKQEQALKDFKGDYTEQCEFLDSISPNYKPLSVFAYKKIKTNREKLESEIKSKESIKEILTKLYEEHKRMKSGGEWVISEKLKLKKFFNSSLTLRSFILREAKKIDSEIAELNKNLNEWKLKTLLYDIREDTKEVYQYGHGWLKRELPENLWEDVLKICHKIEDEERKRKESLSGGEWEDLEPEFKALGKFLDLSPKEAEEEIEDKGNHVYECQGTDYYVADEEDLNQIAIDYLTDDTELYQMWVEAQIKEGNASGIMNIDDWAEYVIRTDGYGQTLNRWDGSEHWDDELKLYIIRQ